MTGNVCDLIARDHDEIADLFEQLAVLARGDRGPEEAERIAARLVLAAHVHSRAEEHVLYDVLRGVPQLKSFALAGPHEHETLDITLDKLLLHRPSEELEVIVRVAHDLFEMHARDEEEADVLPLIAEAFTPADRVALARDFAAEKARIRPQIARLVALPARAA